LQHRAWEYTGWADTKFVRPEQFSALVDTPHFYEKMGLGTSTEAKDRPSNVDAISVGQLLLEFFAFYGYTFDADKYAIDIRHSKTTKDSFMPQPNPFRLRQDFVDEARRELVAQAEGISTLQPWSLFN